MTGRSLLAVAGPMLVRLRDATGEIIRFGVPGDAGQVQIVASHPTHPPVGTLGKVAARVYLQAGSVPKAVLAFMPQRTPTASSRRCPSCRGTHPPPRWTRSTCATSLAASGRSADSIGDQDFEDGARGVGAPVFGPEGRPLAGLSVGGPADRMDDAALERFVA